MNYSPNDHQFYPVKDFIAFSPFLHKMKWTSTTICRLLYSKMGDGHYDSNAGGWLTSKAALVEIFRARNERGLCKKVDLNEVYRGISAGPNSACG